MSSRIEDFESKFNSVKSSVLDLLALQKEALSIKDWTSVRAISDRLWPLFESQWRDPCDRDEDDELDEEDQAASTGYIMNHPELNKITAEISQKIREGIALADSLGAVYELPGADHSSVYVPGVGTLHSSQYGWVSSYCI